MDREYALSFTCSDDAADCPQSSYSVKDYPDALTSTSYPCVFFHRHFEQRWSEPHKGTGEREGAIVVWLLGKEN